MRDKRKRKTIILLNENHLTKDEYNQVKNHKDFDKTNWTFEPRENAWSKVQ